MATTTTRESTHEPGAGPYVESRRRPEPDGTRSTSRSARGTLNLLSRLASELMTLIRQEGELARAEVSEKMDQARSGMAALATGGLVTYTGVNFLLLALFLGINLWIEEPWISAVIVGGAVTLVGLVLLGTARRNLGARNLAPERTARSLRRDAELARPEPQRTERTERTHGREGRP